MVIITINCVFLSCYFSMIVVESKSLFSLSLFQLLIVSREREGEGHREGSSIDFTNVASYCFLQSSAKFSFEPWVNYSVTLAPHACFVCLVCLAFVIMTLALRG